MKPTYERRFWVKIVGGKSQGMTDLVYHRKDLPFEIFMRYQWFFKYREALYRIKNPKHYVEMTTGSYDFVPTKEQNKKSIENKLVGSKRLISKYENLLKKAEETWNELFPITEDEYYKKAVSKINKTKYQLKIYESELANIK